MNLKIKIFELYRLLLLFFISDRTDASSEDKKEEGNWKSFYIMKVIYNSIIYRVLAINARNVQQSLYMGKPTYIMKI